MPFVPADLEECNVKTLLNPVTYVMPSKIKDRAYLRFRVEGALAKTAGLNPGHYVHLNVEKTDAGKMTGVFKLTGSPKSYSRRKWNYQYHGGAHLIACFPHKGDLEKILLYSRSAVPLTILSSENGLILKVSP